MTVMENPEMGAYLRRNVATARDLENLSYHFPVLKKGRKHSAATLGAGKEQMLAMGRELMSNEIAKIIRDLPAEGRTLLLLEQNARLALVRSGGGRDTGSNALRSSAEDRRGHEAVEMACLDVGVSEAAR